MAEKNIGALWEKKGKNGTFYSGQIEIDGTKHDIVVFPNDYKKEDKHPDLKIFKSKPKDGKGDPPPEDKTDLEPF